MIVVNKKQFMDVDKVLAYFEPTVRQITNLFFYNSPYRDDIRQELRLKLWTLFLNENRIYNSSYVTTRLKYDCINFMNRDLCQKGFKLSSSLDNMTNGQKEEILSCVDYSDPNELENYIVIEDIILKAKPILTSKQYEALTLYLSGATTEMIRTFLGTRSRNMTRYYLLLAESFAILREVSLVNT